MKRLFYSAWTLKTPARQLLTAVELSVIAISLRWAVSPWLGEHHEFLPGYAAVVAATWLGTWRAGLTVAVVSLAALQSPLFRGDVYRLPAQIQGAASVIAFVFVAGLLVYLTHHAAQRLHALSDEVSRLDDADHKKSDFLAMIAHELRNPLSAISMGGDLIRSGRLDHSAQQGTWEMMERQTEHMKRLISDLLDVARIEQGKIEIVRETVTVRTLVEQVIKDAYTYTQPKRQVVTLRAGPDAGQASVDALRIGQVLGNVLHNASKFSPEGAPINVTVKTTPEEVQIGIRDSGIGIPDCELKSIFGSFVQLEPDSGRAQGLGLGLALCAKLLQMHEGSIEARSEGIGTGAEFVVRFPRHLPSPIPQYGAPSEPGASTQLVAHAPGDAPLRLLVVDDNHDAADSLATLLRVLGHKVSTAVDGRSALLQIGRDRPDLVFLDLGLPDMSGHEVARRVRQQLAVCQPALVAVTGWGSAEDVSRSNDSGFCAHLTKPVSIEQIKETLTTRRGAALPADALSRPGCACPA